MNTIIIYLLFIVLIIVSMFGPNKPKLYWVDILFSLYVAAVYFTLPGNDWVNSLWGGIMIIVALSYANIYNKRRY